MGSEVSSELIELSPLLGMLTWFVLKKSGVLHDFKGKMAVNTVKDAVFQQEKQVTVLKMPRRQSYELATIIQVAQEYFPYVVLKTFPHLFKLQAKTVYQHLQSTERVCLFLIT